MKILRYILIALISSCSLVNAENIAELKIKGGEVYVSRLIDKSNVRLNPDKTKFYKTKLVVTVLYDGKKVEKELLTDLYTSEDIYWNGITPSMLFDPAENVLTIFVMGKTSENNYGMEGYAFRFEMNSNDWKKEKLFDKSNYGWFSFFDGSNNGQPILRHFSYAGYFSMKSERSPEGSWYTTTGGFISPKQYQQLYKGKQRFLVSSSIDTESKASDRNAEVAAEIVLKELFGLFAGNTSSGSRSNYSSKSSSVQHKSGTVLSLQEGDTGYIFARNAGKTTWFDKKPLIYYAKVSVETVNHNNGKVKVYIDNICWKNAYDEVRCNNDSEGDYRPGDYKWVYKSDIESWPF